MRTLFPLMLIALAFFTLPQALMADDKKPADQPTAEKPPDTPPAEWPGRGQGRPEPAELFKRLDANGDAQITLDELRPRAKERIGRWFPDADKNKDGKLSADEFIAGLKERRKGHPGPPDGQRPWERGPRRLHAGPGWQGPDAPPECRRPRPSPEELFKRLDQNQDKQLSLEEFTEGLKSLRRFHRPPEPPRGPQGAPNVVPPERPTGPEGGL